MRVYLTQNITELCKMHYAKYTLRYKWVELRIIEKINYKTNF